MSLARGCSHPSCVEGVQFQLAYVNIGPRQAEVRLSFMPPWTERPIISWHGASNHSCRHASSVRLVNAALVLRPTVVEVLTGSDRFAHHAFSQPVGRSTVDPTPVFDEVFDRMNWIVDFVTGGRNVLRPLQLLSGPCALASMLEYNRSR